MGERGDTRDSASVAGKGAGLDALPPGSRVAEFEIREVLGEGGFGIVYLAFDHSLGIDVALKEYLPSALAYRQDEKTILPRSAQHRPTFEAGLRSFLQEARVIAQFDHPALVRVRRVWEANGTAYMAMAYYGGPTLRVALKQDPTFATQARLTALLLPLLDGVERLHARRYYHRDIAPDNIIVQPGGAPVLIDFGAARNVIGDMTQALTAVLKPGYAPIEQYAEDSVLTQGPWTDVYGFAATLCYAITGKAPPVAVSRALNDARVPLATLAPAGYDGRFLAGIDAGLAVRPQERPQSLPAFADALGIRDRDDSERTVIVPRVVPPPATPVVDAVPAPPGRSGGVVGEPAATGTRADSATTVVAPGGDGGAPATPPPAIEGVPVIDRAAAVTIDEAPPVRRSAARRVRWPRSRVIGGAVAAAALAGIALVWTSGPWRAPAVPVARVVDSPTPTPVSQADAPSVPLPSPVAPTAAVSPAPVPPPAAGREPPAVAAVPGTRHPPRTLPIVEPTGRDGGNAPSAPGRVAERRATQPAPAPAGPERAAGVAEPRLPPRAASAVPPAATPEAPPAPPRSAAAADSAAPRPAGATPGPPGTPTDARGQYELGRNYELGQGVGRDPVAAVRWFRRAADGGHVAAMTALGFAYESGRGIAADAAEAVRWYQKAAVQGDARAQNNLGFAYESGRGVERNRVSAAAWYRKAADQGYAPAQHNLGRMHEHGWGVAQDDAMATRLYELAAAQGYAWAENSLGVTFATGRGVPRNDVVAVAWYRKAADHGNAVAQANLGYFYETGRGVFRDADQAFRLYSRSAAQGYVGGQARLGRAYELGIGVDKDVAQALFWYRKAAAAGQADAAARVKVLEPTGG